VEVDVMSLMAGEERTYRPGANVGEHRSRLSRQAKIGIGAVGAVVALRVLLGNFVVNEWEGWGLFLGNALATVAEGLVLGGLVFGLLVRLAARSRARRAAVAALITSFVGVLSLAVPYSAPQAIIGAAAVALGLAAREGGEDGSQSARITSTAIGIGLLVIAVWLSFVAFTVATGEWPL
jgi:hypothetical protein